LALFNVLSSDLIMKRLSPRNFSLGLGVVHLTKYWKHCYQITPQALNIQQDIRWERLRASTVSYRVLRQTFWWLPALE